MKDDDPYSAGAWDLTTFRYQMRLGFAVTDPRSLISPSSIPVTYRETWTRAKSARYLSETFIDYFRFEPSWRSLLKAVRYAFQAAWWEHAR